MYSWQHFARVLDVANISSHAFQTQGYVNNQAALALPGVPVLCRFTMLPYDKFEEYDQVPTRNTDMIGGKWVNTWAKNAILPSNLRSTG